MSVWKSNEKLLIFTSLISPSKIILIEKLYQAFNTVVHQQMKHLEVRQKYSAVRRIFNSVFGVSSGDETLRLMLDILREHLSEKQAEYLSVFITGESYRREAKEIIILSYRIIFKVS